LGREEVIRWRAAGLGGYAIVLLDLEFLDGFVEGFACNVVISGPETREAVERHVSARDHKKWLHLTTDEADSAVRKLWDFDRAEMYTWGRRVVEEIQAERKTSGTMRTDVTPRPFSEWPKELIALRTRSHNITFPTEAALKSIGLPLRQGGEPLTGREDHEFADAIAEVVAELDRIREKALADVRSIPGTPTLVLAVPSVFRHLHPGGLRRGAPEPVRKVVRHILRQNQYVAMRISGEETAKILDAPLARGIMDFRAEELQAYTAALSVAGASLCVPVLRCPPQIDRVRELLLRLQGMIRAGNPDVERRNSLAKKIGDALRSALPDPLFRIIEQRGQDGIKLIGDTPLELLPVGGLPLGLRATTSRMPTLPGNLLMRLGMLRAPNFLTADDLRDILVVRAFGRDDPIRDQLVSAIDTVLRDRSPRVNLRVVDVSSKDQFVSAFNAFDGAVAIFDGHGAQARTDPQGILVVGDVRFNPFELYGKIRVPPIVFLSACETHTLEGMESSVASAFLFMGAISVLGTQLSINGVQAAVLIARFLLRFTAILPHLRVAMPWSQVVSGMLRMSYVTDVLRAMERRFSFDEATYRGIHSDANLAINQFQADWFDELIVSLSRATSRSEAEIRDVWMRTCYFTDTLHYVHLGQPEHLFLGPSEEAERSELSA
jgi:hypothetical protein